MVIKVIQIMSLMFAVVFISPVWASNNNVTYQSVDVQDATLTPSKDGSTAILRFKFRNETSETIILLGALTAGFETSEILVKVTDQKTQKLTALSVPSEEFLDLTTNHIFIKLAGGKMPAKPTNEITLRLLLASGELPFVAHVEPYRSPREKGKMK
ncbi:MAG: hypothetical protein V7740_17675 [Pseudomonas marincola]